MTRPENPDLPKLVEPPHPTGPPDPEAPDPQVDIGAREDQPIWWPDMEESRAIMHDYVQQHEKPYGNEQVPLPEDPDPGEEN